MHLKRTKLTDGSSGISPLGPSGKVKSALRKAVKRIGNDPYADLVRLQNLLSSKFGLGSDEVFFANSMNELVHLAIGVFRPSKVLVVGPALQIYEQAARRAGAEVSYVPVTEDGGFAFDPKEIRNKFPDADLVFLANPNRITGQIIKWERFLYDAPQSSGPHFVIDASLLDFTETGKACYETRHSGYITILQTTALFYGLPGLEVASAVSKPEVIDSFKKEKCCDLNLLSIEAARAAYRDSTLQKQTIQWLLTEKKLMLRNFRRYDWIRANDSDSNLMLLKIAKDPELVISRMTTAGLKIRDCSEIKGLDRSFFIIAVMKHENNLKLLSVLKGLDNEIKADQ